MSEGVLNITAHTWGHVGEIYGKNCTLKDPIHVAPVLNLMAGLWFWFYLVLCWHHFTLAYWNCMPC